MELLARSLVDPGDLVLVEAPTYLGAIMAFRGFQAELEGIPMDEHGLRTDQLEILLRRRRPKLLYTIPDFQNPTGATLSLQRRTALVELARRHGVLVVEDVAYRELRFEGESPPSLWSLAPDVVLQIGTFSKTFLSGVRLGWAAGAAPLVAQLTVAKQNTDQCAGALGQRLLEWYGRSGRMDEQVVRSRDLYRRRRDLLATSLRDQLPSRCRWTLPQGGFFLWLVVEGEVDTTALATRAQARGLAYVPGSVFYVDGRGRREMRLAYSRVEDGADRGGLPAPGKPGARGAK
jgi:2-aminoadipate transaminase